MRTYTLLFLLLSMIASANSEKKTPSVIKEVTVYLTGAQIKRTAQVNLKPGVNEILLTNLSPNIEENSIQVSGLKNTSILSINFTIDYLEKKKDSEELIALRNQLEDLLLKKNRLENMLSGLSQEQKILDNNQRISSDNTELSLEKVKQISAYYRERSIEIQNETYTITQKINLIDDNIRDFNHQIDGLDDKTKEKRGEIKLKLDTPAMTNLVLEIRYNVSNAGWFPLYDIKSNSTESPLNIAYKANVYQQTGTDWNNVNIVLSTGDPNTNTIKPNLSTKYLNFTYGSYRSNYPTKRYSYKYNPTVRKVSGIISDQNGQPLPGVNVIEKGTSNGVISDFNGRYTLNIQTGRELSVSYVGFASQEVPIYSSLMNIKLEEDTAQLDEVVVAAYGNSISRLTGMVSGVRSARKKEKADYSQIVETKEEGVTNTRFKIKKKYSINSNADITAIEIDNFDMNADYRHYAAPELNENVFLTAKLGNWEQFNLLAGEANIYFEGSYAGKTNIDPLATTDSLTISLGIDPNIVVQREQLDDFKSTSFTGTNRIINRGYKISIKNNKQSPVLITLEDRIPMSQNKEIKLDDINTSDSKYDHKTGIMKWKLNISSNQKTEKQFSYQVKYPKYKRINL